MSSEIEAAIDDLINKARAVGVSVDYGYGDEVGDLANMTDARARLLALLAPEPEPSEQEIEAAARAFWKIAYSFKPWKSARDYERKTARENAKAVLLAARAARQTGGA